MTTQTRGTQLIGTLAFATCLLAPAQGDVRADDTDLFTSQVAPNVVIIFDNSISMNHIVWHPRFHPDAVYDPINCPYVADETDPSYDPTCLEHPLCPITYGDSEFDAGSGDSWSTTDGGVFQTDNGTGTIVKSDDDSNCGDRVVFHDPEVEAAGSDTLWNVKYLQWYFSANVDSDPDGDGQTILQDILDTDDGVASACLIAAGKPATYAKYRRARMTAGKNILREVICNTSQVADIRYGLAKFYTEFFWFFLTDPDGGYVSVPVDDYSTTQAQALEDAIDQAEGETFTPLSETLYNVYRYFQSRTSTATAFGKDDTTRFPVYDFNTSGGTTGTIPASPVTDSSCQKHFVIVITDGEPTFDDFTDMNQTTFVDNLIGDYKDPGDETEAPGDAVLSSKYLDDVAAFMQNRDFLPGSSDPGTQVIDVYTVGFTTNDTANDLLGRAAVAGNGQFFSSSSPEELTDALTKTINEIVTKSKAFTAATVPASRATDGNNFYASYFNPSKDNPYWAGHLKAFDFTGAGEIKDAPSPTGTGECALDDPNAPTSCAEGALKLTLNGFWDAANEIPAPASRDLYVSNYPSAAPTTIPSTPLDFTWTGGGRMTAADLGVSGATAADIAAYDLGLGSHDVTGITTDEELADAITKYVSGCNFDDTTTCTDRGDGQKLWDIFHANPVVVGPPNAGLREPTYREFVTTYRHRTRLIYTGSNGALVHAFDAGAYDRNVSGAYDRGTGAEEFGFMAYPARQNLKLLAKDDPPRGRDGWSGYTMDGSVSAADIWLYTDAVDDPDDSDMNWVDWRTVAIGGMRQGGRTVWGLDITNPDGETGGPAFPGYMWEFPCEASSCDGWRPYMGESWSQPVITRVKVTIDCDGATCPTYDRWVAIFGGGYDEAGDPNLAHETVAASVTAGEYDASNSGATSTAGRALFMVDIKTGQVLAAKRFQHNGTTGDSSDGEPLMKYALPSAPSVFDLNFDGYADMVVIGDLGGNVWKWVIHDAGQDHINGSEGTDQQARWPFLRLMTAENCASCSPPHFKSFFFPPTGALVGANLWLAFGTGERTDLDYAQDGTTDAKERNRFYVMKDMDPFELERDPTSLPYTDAGTSTDFADASTFTDFNPNSCLQTGEVGYYLEGEDGEKFITNSIIFFGVVFTGSYVPPPSTANACTAAGDGYLYGFDLFCGEGGFPPSSGNSSDPRERRIHVGEGLPTAPRVSVGALGEAPDDGGDPCQDMVIMITSEGGGFTDGRCDRQGRGLKVKTWRDE